MSYLKKIKSKSIQCLSWEEERKWREFKALKGIQMGLPVSFSEFTLEPQDLLRLLAINTDFLEEQPKTGLWYEK